MPSITIVVFNYHCGNSNTDDKDSHTITQPTMHMGRVIHVHVYIVVALPIIPLQTEIDTYQIVR